ncbi:MAG: NAD(P)-binding domain-containing protein [Myxococcales bacterium]|nr:NAD(P)-binding domain-containing protein [Myxococcales bacterium]
MTGSVGPGHAPLVSTRREEVGRRRVAPKAIETSDVTRHRGVLLAVLLACVAVVGAVLASAALGVPLSTPRPLSRPHRVAEVECTACHQHEAADPSMTPACLSCHGEHPSTRPGHASLAAAGQLRCITCHAIHTADAGVTFTRDGQVHAYRSGAEERLDWPAPAFLDERDVTVPLVSAVACGGCHRLDDPRDPAAGCVLAGQQALGERRPAVCFDEHRDVLTATAQGRTSAWDAAREVARARPTVEAPAPKASFAAPALWVGSGLLSGLLLLGAYRGTRRIRTRLAKTTALPSHAVLPAKIRKLPQVNTNTCIGCSACVDACPYDVLEIHNYVAQVVRPDDCCGLTLCEQRCPNGSLVITDGEAVEDRPHMTDALESIDTPGVYLAGDLTGLPLIGDLWLEKSTKEEILAKWTRIVHAQQLVIHEQCRVTGVQRVAAGPGAGGLQVGYVGPDGVERGVSTKRVLLAFGRRGSPRKLPVEIPDAFADHVHYSVADARSFAGMRVLVVGLGDVAMECAIAIANQPGSEVSISYRGADFKRGKAKNMEEVRRLIASFL